MSLDDSTHPKPQLTHPVRDPSEEGMETTGLRVQLIGSNVISNCH